MNAIWKWLLNWDLGEVLWHNNKSLTFAAEYNNYVKLAMLAAFVAMVWLTVRGYRREGDAPRRAKAVLAGLRIAAIAAVFAILLRPAIVLRYVRTLTSPVVLLIDDSQSMSFADRYDEPNLADQRLALATALSVDAGRLGDLSRGQIATLMLTSPASPVARLSADHPIVVVRYSTTQPSQSPGDYVRRMGVIDASVAAADQAAGAGSEPNAPLERLAAILAGLTQSGYSTNPSLALRGALDLLQDGRPPVIVHVSDGQLTSRSGGDGRLASAMDYARQRGATVYSVIVGDPTPPRTVSVTALQAPREMRRGAQIEFTAVLAYRNMDGQKAELRLLFRRAGQQEWSDTGARQSVAFDAASGEGDARRDQAVSGANAGQSGQGLTSVAMHLEAPELGEFEYKAVVDGRGGARDGGEGLDAVAPVSVGDEKIRILLVSGDAGWEFQYLRNFFLQQPDLYRLSTWQQNGEKEVNQSASTGMKLSRLPRTLEELIGAQGDANMPGYNVVMLYDPQPTQDGFDRHFVQDLLRPFVEKHHGGLCYISGNKYSESTLLSAEGQQEFSDLAAMLPVTLASDSLGDIYRIGEGRPEPYPVRLTPYGMEHPVTRLGGTSGESQQVWSDVLPGIFWSQPVYKPKPGARVLAYSSNPMRRLVARNEPLPLLAVQPFGRGNVLYVGFDDSWRWRMVRDGYYHRRFWANVVRFLSTLQARRLTITTGGSRFGLGEKIAVEVEAYDEAYQPLRVESVSLDVTDLTAGAALPPLVLEAVEGKPGIFRKNDFQPPQKGFYRLSPPASLADANDPANAKQIVVEPPSAEFARTEADEATMKNLSWPAGKFLRIDQLDRLAEIPAGRWTSTTELPRDLWDTKLALLAVVTLLTLEWLGRKKYNMT